jgi:hypothetical protein
MFDWVVFDKGRARFCGSQRDTINGGGQEILAVQLEGGPPYYGEFDTKFDADGARHNVEVLSFGCYDKLDVGLPGRRAFLPDEIEGIRRIISALMLSDFEKPFPLHKSERFLGKTLFKEGWISER